MPRVFSTALFVLGFAALTASEAGAQASAHSLAGTVTDSAGRPIPDVRVVLQEVGRRNVSGPEGTFSFAAVPAGTYTVSLSKLGFSPETRRITLGRDQRISVTMRVSGVHIAAVQVTATMAASTASESPQPTAVLEGAELRTSQATSLGDVLESIPGVRSLSMTTGIGKPVIRGMTHYRVVTLDNGQRTETQAWGHDHSPNVETAAAERVEVIKGPSSVLYGSDALGGVVNVIAPPVPDALDVDRFVRGQIIGSYNANIRGTDGTLITEAASGGLGMRAALTMRSSDDMRTPAGPMSNTKNRALAAETAVGLRGSRGTAHVRYVSRDERIEIFDNPVTNPDYTGYQKIATHRLVLETSLALRGSRLQTSAGYEDNFRQEFANMDAPTPDLGLYVRNWTGFAHFHHSPLAGGMLTGTFGLSGMLSDFENRGSQTLIPASNTRNAAAYFFEQATLADGRFKLTAGGRYDFRTLSTEGDAGITVPAQSRVFRAVTGSVGALYKITEPVSVVLNLARGFRAPSAPDLFANGFHEGTRAFERGDPGLDVETSLNTDLGVRIQRTNLTAETTMFYNRVKDYIYLRPFGTGGGAFDSLRVVQGNARLLGLEGRIAYRPITPLTLQLSGDYVRGDNLSADVPLTFIPPVRVLAGFRLERDPRGRTGPQPYFTTTVEMNGAQKRVDPRDIPTAGYSLVTFGTGFTRSVPRGIATIDLSMRNAFNVTYRSFMSRYKEFAIGQGRAIVLRASTSM